MISRVVASNDTLRVFGRCMALAGLLDGVIQFSHGKAFGFAAFACVLAVYYVYRARPDRQALAASINPYRNVLGRGFLLLVGICVIEFCLIQVATHVSWLSGSEWLGVVMAWIFIGTMCVTTLCLVVIVLERLGVRPAS